MAMSVLQKASIVTFATAASIAGSASIRAFNNSSNAESPYSRNLEEQDDLSRNGINTRNSKTTNPISWFSILKEKRNFIGLFDLENN